MVKEIDLRDVMFVGLSHKNKNSFIMLKSVLILVLIFVFSKDLLLLIKMKRKSLIFKEKNPPFLNQMTGCPTNNVKSFNLI